MNQIKKQVGGVVALLGAVWSCEAAVIQNVDPTFWSTSQNWTNTAIWNGGPVPGTTDNVIMAAKPVDYTVEISSGDVTINSLKTNYQTDGDIPTLYVSTNVTITTLLEMGVTAGGTLQIADGGNVTVSAGLGKAYFGTGSFAGTLAVEKGGFYRSYGEFRIGANGQVQVDGIFQSINKDFATALTIDNGGSLYIGNTGTVFLKGDQTGNQSLLDYINNGDIAGANPITMNYNSDIDATRLMAIPEPMTLGLFVVGSCLSFFIKHNSQQ